MNKKMNWIINKDWKLLDGVITYDGLTITPSVVINDIGFSVLDYDEFKKDIYDVIFKHLIWDESDFKIEPIETEVGTRYRATHIETGCMGSGETIEDAMFDSKVNLTFEISLDKADEYGE